MGCENGCRDCDREYEGDYDRECRRRRRFREHRHFHEHRHHHYYPRRNRWGEGGFYEIEGRYYEI
jgi:hypothetical protein